jgi:hypothetical protein
MQVALMKECWHELLKLSAGDGEDSFTSFKRVL